MQRHKHWAWLLLCLPLASCSVIDEYIRPKPVIAEQWQAPLPHSGSVVALKDWWAQFKDPVLDQLLAESQKESPSLEIALANIRVARANVLTSEIGKVGWAVYRTCAITDMEK